MERIIWPHRVGNEVLHAVKKEKNVLQAIKNKES
jgi:hypothetical protein